MSAYRALTDNLAASLDDREDWSLTIEDVADLLSIDETELYGRLYRRAHREGVRSAVAGYHFTPESAGELVSLLESIFPGNGRASPEAEFTRAGLFIPHALRADLQERLVRQFIADYIIHSADLSTFDAMLRATRRAGRAIELYIDEYFPLEPAIERTAGYFAGDGGYPRRMAVTAAGYLRSLFRRHILDRVELLAPLVRLLRGRAHDTGYLRTGGQRQAGSRAGGGESTNEEGGGRLLGELERARSLFGLATEEATPALIRERYKSLMRKYHPDVNPKGLEMSKRINVSYALLLESVGS